MCIVKPKELCSLCILLDLRSYVLYVYSYIAGVVFVLYNVKSYELCSSCMYIVQS